MTTENVHLPPFELVRALTDWSSQPSEFIFRHLVENSLHLRELYQHAKNIVVWLEMHEYEDAAAVIGEAARSWKDAWLEFSDQCERSAPEAPEDPRCREALDSLMHSTECFTAQLEDAGNELPESVWRGFDDD